MPSVLIFDGVCNLCTASVQFILRHEAAPSLRFAPLQSPAGERLLRERGLDPAQIQTLVLIEDGTAFVKSAAALRLARHLRLPWRLLRLAWIIPRALRDRIYAVVATHRYRWFGRRKSCLIPTSEVAARFLND